MEQLNLTTLAFIGLLLLSVPALMAGLFPVMEKTISLVAVTFGLQTAKGIIFWVIVLGVFIYFTALPTITYILREIRLSSF